jgi:hypothetical protein
VGGEIFKSSAAEQAGQVGILAQKEPEMSFTCQLVGTAASTVIDGTSDVEKMPARSARLIRPVVRSREIGAPLDTMDEGQSFSLACCQAHFVRASTSA